MLGGQLLRLPHGFLGLVWIPPDVFQPRQHGAGDGLKIGLPPLAAKIDALMNILIRIVQSIAFIGQSAQASAELAGQWRSLSVRANLVFASAAAELLSRIAPPPAFGGPRKWHAGRS